MSFFQNEIDATYWYVCNGCHLSSVRFPLGEPPSDLYRNWKTEYENVHLCPACQPKFQEAMK